MTYFSTVLFCTPWSISSADGSTRNGFYTLVKYSNKFGSFPRLLWTRDSFCVDEVAKLVRSDKDPLKPKWFLFHVEN